MNVIHRACAEGNLTLVRKLLDEDKDLINLQDARWWTPLFYACDAVDEDIMAFLLENGADVNIRDERLRSALHVTVDREYAESLNTNVASRVVRMLLDAGADPQAKDVEGDTALWKLWLLTDHEENFKPWHWEIIDLLIQEESPKDPCVEGVCTPVHNHSDSVAGFKSSSSFCSGKTDQIKSFQAKINFQNQRNE